MSEDKMLRVKIKDTKITLFINKSKSIPFLNLPKDKAFNKDDPNYRATLERIEHTKIPLDLKLVYTDENDVNVEWTYITSIESVATKAILMLFLTHDNELLLLPNLEHFDTVDKDFFKNNSIMLDAIKVGTEECKLSNVYKEDDFKMNEVPTNDKSFTHLITLVGLTDNSRLITSNTVYAKNGGGEWVINRADTMQYISLGGFVNDPIPFLNVSYLSMGDCGLTKLKNNPVDVVLQINF